MKTKKLLLSLFAFFTLTANQKLFASHIVGAMITYEYVAPNQYLITFKLYRDCAGIPAPTTVAICYQSTNASLSGAVTLNLIPGTGNEIFPYPCYTAAVSTCQGGTGFGVQEWDYNGVVTLPAQASDWIFSWEQCCRSINVTTITNAAGLGFYVYAKLDNLNFPINSSPQLTSANYPQFCLGVLSDYHLPFIDADGDSLTYSLVPAQDANLSCPMTPFALSYNAPYSATNPISSSTPILFNSSTGTLTFTPVTLQAAVFCLLVQEWRNGVLIGEVNRDEMAFTTNGVIDPNWMKGKVFYDQNGNTVYDAGEPAMPDAIVELQPGTFYANVNPFGDYAIPLSVGSFSTSIPNPPPYFVSTPLMQTATFTGTFQTDSMNDFALTLLPNVQDFRVELTGPNVIPGTTTNIHLYYENAGSVAMGGSVSFVYDTNLVYVNSSVPPYNISGDTLTWLFSSLAPFNSLDITNTFSLPASVPLNTPLTSYAEILPVTGDTAPSDNYDILERLVLTSCDPNEKIVDPAGPITTTQVANGQFMEYTINFQNIGTAPAVNVFIDDTLDQNFNIPTFEVISASHYYTWQIKGPGIIKFTFDNIMLPDSGTNEFLSHGFIKYRIRPKNNLIVGDKMTNTAYIVFDNNAALATNSTSTTVINPVTISELSDDISDLIIYPNPTNNILNIEMHLKESVSLNIQLFNLMGEIIKESKSAIAAGSFKKQLNMNDISGGIYFLKIETLSGVKIMKVVKN